jgi:hypothetical protein
MNRFGKECFVSDLSDRQAIFELAAAYSDAVNRKDWSAMADVYCERGELSLGDAPPIVGREAIRRSFEQLMSRDRDYVFQMTHSGVIDLRGDSARSRWWFSELKKPTGGAPEYLFGVYEDQIVRLAEGWFFARRSARRCLTWVLESADVAQWPLCRFQELNASVGRGG